MKLWTVWSDYCATDEAQARKAIKNFVNKDFGFEVEQIIEVK